MNREFQEYLKDRSDEELEALLANIKVVLDSVQGWKFYRFYADKRALVLSEIIRRTK